MANGPPEGSWNYEIVHRDIKPENGEQSLVSIAPDHTNPGRVVFLGIEDLNGFPFYPTAKLGDYGLAVKTNLSDQNNPWRLTGAGTRRYLAPEQKARRQRPIAHQRDDRLSSHTNIWGIGAVMYELLTLHSVQRALFPHEVDPAGTREGLGPITTLKVPEYSTDLRSLIRKCLRPNPHDRPRIGDLEDQTAIFRKHFNDYYEGIREQPTTPHEDERLYYRGKEIEWMSTGNWLPTYIGHNSDDQHESGFPDPDLSPMEYPKFSRKWSDGGPMQEVVLEPGWDVGPDGVEKRPDPDRGEEERVERKRPIPPANTEERLHKRKRPATD